MGASSYKTELRYGGAPTSVEDAPTERLGVIGSGVFRIVNAAQRIISPSHALVVMNAVTDAVLPVAAINYMEGIILLANGADGAQGVKLDYYYIGNGFIGGSKDYSLELSGDLLDNTAFHPTAGSQNQGFRSRQYGLNDVTVSLSRWSDAIQDLRASKMARNRVLIIIRPGGAESKMRASGWFVTENFGTSGDVGGLEEESVSFNLESVPSNISDSVASLGVKYVPFSFTDDITVAESAAMVRADLIALLFAGLA